MPFEGAAAVVGDAEIDPAVGHRESPEPLVVRRPGEDGLSSTPATP